MAVNTIVLLAKWLLPGSWSLFLTCVTLAAVLLFQRRPRGRALGRGLLAATVVCYWALSLPVVADALQGTYPADREAPTVPDEPLAIVVLGAGVQSYRVGEAIVDVPAPQSVFNVLEGAALFQKMGSAPVSVIVSGGKADPARPGASEADVLAPLLCAHGVPDARIIRESASSTTRTQAVNVAQLARAHGIGRLIVVTSPAHLRRAVPAFRAAGGGRDWLSRPFQIRPPDGSGALASKSGVAPHRTGGAVRRHRVDLLPESRLAQ